METDLYDQRRRAADAKARLGEVCPLQGELDVKRAQLAEIEADLASTEGMATRSVRHRRGTSPPDGRQPFGSAFSASASRESGPEKPAPAISTGYGV